MRIGILTLPFEANYGWAVQRWALYHTIEKLGHQPTIINRRWSSNNTSCINSFKRFVYYNVICPRFKRFVDKETPSVTPVTRTPEETFEVSKHLDAVIVGSDQVWRIENTRLAGLDFFLDFLKDSPIKRLSYAASFGKDTWQGTEDETIKVKNLLQKFNAISVREDSGVCLCNNLFDVESSHVLDPTLLLTADDYNQLLSKPKSRQELVTYILDSTEEKRNTVSEIARQCNLKEVNLYPSRSFTFYKSVYTWLEKIRDAHYVVVDSFHGMVFCILFHKQFAVFANSKRGLTRFTSLLGMLGLIERMTTVFGKEEVLKILKQPIDYVSVESMLATHRKKSLGFLENNL